MMSPEALCAKIDDLLKDTKNNHLKWRLEIQTSEYDDDDKKIVIKEDNKDWLMDECYVCFTCNYHGEDFNMVTYEDIETCEGKTRSLNMVFLPPAGMHLFDLNVLVQYSVETNAVLTSKVHTLWDTLLTMHKEQNANVEIIVDKWIPDEEHSGK